MAAVDAQLEKLRREGEHYLKVAEICDSLDKLSDAGAASLFWGNREETGAEHVKRVRQSVERFEGQVAAVQERRDRIEENVQEQRALLATLYDEILETEIQEERKKDEFVVEREINHLPYRITVMPWARSGEDDKRFRKAVLVALLVSIFFGYLIPLWDIPAPENEVVEVPERLARLVKQQQPTPPPEPPQPKEEKPTEKKEEPTKEKPTVAEKKKAREKAEGAGVLAFKDSFSDLIDNAPDVELGVKARVTNAGKTSGATQRSIIAQEAQGSSGGINVAALSRDVGGGSGDQIDGVKFSRVNSAIGTDMEGGGDRPLSDGPGPSRTDEEIQIVFDRYKATLYRIYNRELRRDPTLQGKMVLRITIEPNGSVSACKVESTDLDSSALSQEIVARVERFNFGPKEGVPPVTILYPIDFLPAI